MLTKFDITDADVGFLARCMWANGGGAKGSVASQKRLEKLGLIVKKGMNYNSINEQVCGHRYNITPAGKKYLNSGLYINTPLEEDGE